MLCNYAFGLSYELDKTLQSGVVDVTREKNKGSLPRRAVVEEGRLLKNACKRRYVVVISRLV